MSQPFHHVIPRIHRRLARITSRRMVELTAPTGVVSITFDDAPHSACTVGRDVLESHGCRGTWYVAGGLTGEVEQGLPCHSLGDLHRLVAHGHHLGCHTFSHRPCPDMTANDMAQEIARNHAFLTELGVPEHDRHFSFPLGRVDMGSKRRAAQHFASLRVIDGGVQTGRIDLNGLAAVKLYEGVTTPASLHALVQQAAASRGWLIFYTHDIDPSPSFMGCTPALLDAALDLAKRAGCEVLPVNEVVQRYTRR